MPGKHHHHKDLGAYRTTQDKLEKEHTQHQPAGQASEQSVLSDHEDKPEMEPPPSPAPVAEAGKAQAMADAKIAELQAKLAASEDKSLRMLADLENMRKRLAREKVDAVFATQFDILSSIIPVLDHFELALASAVSSNNLQALIEGMRPHRS